MSGHKVAWGSLIAGAAVAAGAVMVAPWLVTETAPQLVETLSTVAKDVAAWVGSFFTAEAASKAAEVGGSGASKLVEALTSDTARKVAGSALIGGGLIHLMGEKPAPALSVRADDTPSESFAMKEDIRRMQALMQVRMAAAGMHPAAGMARG